MENWKTIKGYEGLYEISNLGRVRSLKSAKILKTTDNGNGYKIIGLCKNNKRKNFYIHRLVAKMFLENSRNCEHVNHKDYDIGNNCVDNLEWVTPRENVIYSLPNRPTTTKHTNNYGKYIKKDKRYSGYIVVVGLPQGKRKYLGRFETIEIAKEQRDKFLLGVQNGEKKNV